MPRPNPEKDKAWRIANAERLREWHREYRTRMKDRLNFLTRKRRSEHPEKHRAVNAAWRLKNLERHREMNRKNIKKRLKADPAFRAVSNLRKRLRSFLFGNSKKSARTMELVGCSSAELMDYLKARFYGEMTEANYGRVWHIDHIIPCAMYDARLPDHQRACFHYTNLQPLLAKDNIRKWKHVTWAAK